MKKVTAALLLAGHELTGLEFGKEDNNDRMMDAGIARLAERMKEFGLAGIEGTSITEFLISDIWHMTITEVESYDHDDELFHEWKAREGIKNLMRNLP